MELSLREAMQLGHSHIGSEHLVLALVHEGEGVGAQVLASLGADFGRVRQQVIQLMSGHGGPGPAEVVGIPPDDRAVDQITAVITTTFDSAEHATVDPSDRFEDAGALAPYLQRAAERWSQGLRPTRVRRIRFTSPDAAEVLFAGRVASIQPSFEGTVRRHGDRAMVTCVEIEDGIDELSSASEHPPASVVAARTAALVRGAPRTLGPDAAGTPREFTTSLLRTLHVATLEHQGLLDERVSREHLALGVLRQKSGIVAEALARGGVDRVALRRAIFEVIEERAVVASQGTGVVDGPPGDAKSENRRRSRGEAARQRPRDDADGRTSFRGSEALRLLSVPTASPAT